MSEINKIGKEYSLQEMIKFVSLPVLSEFVLAVLQTFDDGLFLARYVGEYGIAAFQILMPMMMIISAFSEMLCGASVVCATKMGEGKNEEANNDFTTIALVVTVSGLFSLLLYALFSKQILDFFCKSAILKQYASEYMSIAFYYFPLMMLSWYFSRFYIIAGKPQMSMITMVASSLINLFFDWLLIVRLHMGMAGAATANLISNLSMTLLGFIVFSRKNSEIKFAGLSKNIMSLIIKSCSLGLPQLLTTVAISVNAYISNNVIQNIAAEDGTAAYAIANNIQFMFTSGIFGLSSAVSPLISYAYGEKDFEKIVRTVKKVLVLAGAIVVVIILIYILGKEFFIRLYLGNEKSDYVQQLTRRGLEIAPYGFVFLSYNIMIITIYQSLNDSITSSVFTVLENLVMNNLTILILPSFYGIDGIWFAFPLAEFLCFIIMLIFSPKRINIKNV